MSTKFVLVVVAALLAVSVAIGIKTPLSDGVAARATVQIASVDDAWRAALPSDPAAATTAYMARLSPQARARSDAYFEGGYWLQGWAFVANLLACWMLLASGVLQRLSQGLERSRLRRVRLLVVSMAFVLLTALLGVPCRSPSIKSSIGNTLTGW